MSLLFKRKGSPYWYVTKTRESTKTINRKLAEEFARKSLTEHWRTEALGEVAHTWDELHSDWLDRKDSLASYEQDKMVIQRFSELLKRLEITSLTDIDAHVVAEYGKVVKAKKSAATANRHFTTLRAMLNYAKDEKEWLKDVPRITNYHVIKKEPQWLTHEQFNLIIQHLPEWVADMAIVAMQTGMRFSNVAGLKWEWISPDNSVAWVPAVHAKTERTYTVPLSSITKEIFAKLRAKQLHPVYVFVGKQRIGRGRTATHVDCVPVPSVRYWWETAVERSGLPYIRWHAATRHTFASLHTQNGTPDRVLKEMGGWASMKMLENYAHLSTKHLVEFADNLNSV